MQEFSEEKMLNENKADIIADIFGIFTDLSKYGNEEDYSKYLDTIFPNSKIKEIVYLSDKYQGSVENLIAKKIFEMSNITYRELSLRTDLISDMSNYFNSMRP